jgi:hypothetical protein
VALEALEIAEQIDDRQRASQCCQMALERMFRFGDAPITRSPAWREWADRTSHYAASGTNQQVIVDVALARVSVAQRRWSEYRKLTVRAGELARKLKEPEVLFEAMIEMIGPYRGVQHNPERFRLAEEFIGVPKEGVRTSTLSLFLRYSQGVFLAAGKRDRAEEMWRELD